jgi:cytochrome c551
MNRFLRLSMPFITLMLWGCESGDVKFRQYYNKGESLYELHCKNCHQDDGGGLRQLYPPLAKADYLMKNKEDVICLIRNGKKGSIVVNGQEYNMAMPGNKALTDLEIAQILTYVYNTWENKAGLIDVKHVSPVLSECSQ